MTIRNKAYYQEIIMYQNMRRVLFTIITFIIGLNMISCGTLQVTETSLKPASTIPNTSSITSTETLIPTPTETLLPAPAERPSVTAERVKNIIASLKLGMDEKGNITGLPEEFPQEKKNTIKDYYEAIQKRFPGSQVFYDQDPKGNNWILYAKMGSRLFYETLSYAGGPEQYSDVPFTFDNSNGSWKVIGNYQAIPIPGMIGVIWNNNIPEFLSGRSKLFNRDTYFKYYMDYNSYAKDSNPWRIIPDVSEIIDASRKQDISGNSWRLSPDGHIYYRELELYDGFFTINKQQPKNVQQYWEDIIRGLWNLNSISKNNTFLSQFPTDKSLIEYLNKGGGPINNLWIPVIYPDNRRQFYGQATMVPLINSINLSQIAISIYRPSNDEIEHYSQKYNFGNNYISYLGAAGETLVESIEMNGNNILKFTFRRDLTTDDEAFLALTEDKTPDENLLAATQMMRWWILEMQISDDPINAAKAWTPDLNPPLLDFGVYFPSAKLVEVITTLDGTPLAIR